MSRGAVAAGHPETAEAGAWALREGGNAVDAAVAAVAASLTAESPLTGLGAGGHMLIHGHDEEPVLVDFFVAAPGLGPAERASELVPIDVDFGGTTQVFNVGAASCGVPGTPAGLAAAAEAHGSMPLAELVRPGIRLAADGLVLNREQAYLIEILSPILTREPAGKAIYAPNGSLLRAGDRFHFPDLALGLERLGAEGAEPFYRGEVAERICAWVQDRGGALDPEDLGAYEPIFRRPVRAGFAGREILTNPPPSSGGTLIAYALELLERIGEWGIEALVTVMEEAQAVRTKGFLAGLYSEGFADAFLAEASLDAAAERCRALMRRPPRGSGGITDRLGSTTHITAVDADGRCASVTCSNGTGSGLVVPGTGVHVNNMLGEQDLNPFGYHSTAPGLRMPSMMSPTVVLRGGELEVGLGSGGSNRIRSAIVQTILRIVGDGLDAPEAVAAPRAHFEDGIVDAEPGVDPAGLARLEGRGYEVHRWSSLNLFFGGVHAVVRDPGMGALSGGGDPRRGGSVAAA